MKYSCRSLLIVGLLVLVAGCSTSGTPTHEDWSRSYVRPFDRVWTESVEALDDLDFYLETEDRERGVIRAESRSKREYGAVVLDIRITSRGEVVLVDVKAAGGPMDSPALFARFDETVSEFLLELDARLRG
jgi:hypothetical protein